MNEQAEFDRRPLLSSVAGEESSSDDEGAAVGWSQKHSLLNADHLQLELWRDMLRDEIEEDLQRQVRTRLGLDYLPVTGCVQSSVDTGANMFYRPRLVTPHYDHAPSLMRVTTESNPDSQSAVNEDQELGRDKPTKLVVNHQRISRRGLEFVPHPISSEPVVAHPAVESQPRRREHQQTLSEYVNYKYGVPMEQLLHLSSTGTFQTQLVDTTGDGGGPFIHAPIEANILFPTPKHVTATSPFTLPTSHAPCIGDNTRLHPDSSMKNSAKGHTHTSSSKHGARQVVYNGGADGGCTSNRLHFEARFEGGNLQQAVQVGLYEYQLSLNSDLYSTKHTQWFYFKVERMVAMTTYTFHIINFYKPDSLYNYGMQPLLYSSHEARLKGGGWSRVGTNVRYYSANPISPNKYYTLTWEMVFPHTEDECYLAHCYPYPYTKLVNLLETIEQCPSRGRYVRRESMCKTLAGNDCPLLTITDYEAPPHTILSRNGIVVSARVHPGETNSSWMMEGLLHMLTADTTHAKILRSQFVFKVIPMLNPDGVIVGNYRTSLAGVDLNRVYKNTVPELFPTVAHTKVVVDSLVRERKVALYIDLHGHSRKQNVFMYGCHTPQCDHTQFLDERVFPFLVSQQAPQMFSYSSCKFGVHRSKESTGRVVMWRRGVSNSFTMEATFCGSTLGHSRQFVTDDLVEMGRLLGEAIYRYHQMSASKSYEQKVMGQLADLVMQSTQTAQPNLPDLVTAHEQSLSPRGEGGGKPKKSKSNRRVLRRFMKFDLSQLQESSTSGSDSENDKFEFKRKKPRVKKAKRASSLHARTQPLLPTHPPPHTTHESQPSQPHRPRLSGQVSNHSTVPLPPLTRFSAPPRMQGGDRRTAFGWKFINKYKGRSNGGIPIFSEERLKERAEKQKLQSMSMHQPLTSKRPVSDIKMTHNHEAQSKTKPKVSTSFLWQPVTTDDSNKQERCPGRVENTVARQQSLISHERASRGRRGQPSLERVGGSRRGQHTSLQHYNHVRHLLASRSVGASGHGLPPTLARYIRELWSKTD